MQVPLEITFKNMEHSDPVEAVVRERVDKLGRYFRHIISCRVALEVTNRTPNQDARNYRVSIDISVPGEELVVSREPTIYSEFTDIYVTIRDAFNAADRQLQSYSGRLREPRKPRDMVPFAVVNKMFPGEGYGFLMTSDGREIYFHENSVSHPGFNELNEGDAVRFVETMGDEGPQASMVEGLGRDGAHMYPQDTGMA